MSATVQSMKLYHYAKSRSTRVLWLLAELGVDFEAEMLPFDPRAFALADHFDLDTYGALPILVDDASSMSESIAIMHYVLDRYSQGRLQPPRDSHDYGKFLEWIQFGETTLMGPLTQMLQHSVLLPAAERLPAIAAQGKRAFTYFARSIDSALAGQDYLLGDEFSAADIVIGYALYLADDCGALPRELKSLCAYYERLSARPAFKIATSD